MTQQYSPSLDSRQFCWRMSFIGSCLFSLGNVGAPSVSRHECRVGARIFPDGFLGHQLPSRDSVHDSVSFSHCFFQRNIDKAVVPWWVGFFGETLRSDHYDNFWRGRSARPTLVSLYALSSVDPFFFATVSADDKEDWSHQSTDKLVSAVTALRIFWDRLTAWLIDWLIDWLVFDRSIW